MAASTQEDKRSEEEESGDFGTSNGDENCKILSGEATAGRGRVSIFCRSCLHPYSGKEKGGSVILRCEKCGHRDVVREEETADIDPSQYSGNLMLNRFLNVFQDKKITLNLSDSESAGDGYEDLCGALEDYMGYLNRVFDKYQKIITAAKERHNNVIMEEYNSILQKRMVGCFQDGNKKVGENAFKEGDLSNFKELETSISEPNLVLFGLLKPDAFNLTPEENAKLREVIKDPLECVKEICERRKLPQQILTDVSTRINCPLPEDREDSIAAVLVYLKEQERLRSEGRNMDEEEFEELERLVDEEEREVKRRSKEKETEECFVNMKNGTDVSEVDNEVNSKGDMSCMDGNLECKDNAIGESRNESVYNNVSENVSRVPRSNPTKHREQEHNPGHMKKETVESINRVCEEKETVSSENDQSRMTQDERDRWEEFQFQAASNGFLKAVQRQKNLILVRRGRRAMEQVHQQIEAMKAEVFRVEHEVCKELRQAYTAKMEKANNQRKIIEEKHQQVKDLRELIDYYRETHQDDKLRELLNSLDLPKEN